MRQFLRRIPCFILGHTREVFTPKCDRCGLPAYRGVRWGWNLYAPGKSVEEAAMLAVLDDDYVRELEDNARLCA